jgi:hypothetical protein
MGAPRSTFEPEVVEWRMRLVWLSREYLPSYVAALESVRIVTAACSHPLQIAGVTDKICSAP